MNQLRGWTPFSSYNRKAITTSSPTYRVDEIAAFNAFKRHWQHICEIFDQTAIRNKVTSDDVTAVINHYGQMINFLLVDLRKMSNKSLESDISDNCSRQPIPNGNSSNSLHTPIFDLFLGERVLQSVFQWSFSALEFFNSLQLEQLKVYETLLSNSHPEILMYKPITQPLLNLLESCSSSIPIEVERRLVVVLNQLWVSVLHNQHLLKYFLKEEENEIPKLSIFCLLLPFIHREGGLGQQSRDALLLSMCFSASDSRVTNFILSYSNFCPVLAAGLSGLYSMLPRSLNVTTEGWFRISSDDIQHNQPFQMLTNSLEFCNAIVQSADPSIQRQLVDYLYQGFLVPVVGPSLLQTVLEEIVAAIVYVEFFLRCITEGKLLRAFLALLLSKQEYSELPLLTSIISHLHSSNVQLNLVTLNLFNTLIGLHSEDVMVFLVFQYLTPCTHIMLSQRSKLSQPPEQLWKIKEDSTFGPDGIHHSTPFSVYLREARRCVREAWHACITWAWPYDSQAPLPVEAYRLVNAARLIPIVPYSRLRVESDIGPSCTYSLPFERITEDDDPEASDKRRSWSLPSYQTKQSSNSPTISRHPLPSVSTTVTSLKKKNRNKGMSGKLCWECEDSRLDSLGGSSSGYESYNPAKVSCESSPSHSSGLHEHKMGLKSSPDVEDINEEFFLQLSDLTQKESFSDEDFSLIDDLFESFCYPVLDNRPSCEKSDEPDLDLESILNPTITMTEEETSTDDNEEEDAGDPLIESHPKPTVGPFLEALINQIDNLMTSNIDASLLAMTCLSKLAAYPCPLVSSLILKPSIVLQPAVRSLYQVLGQLKQKIDVVLNGNDSWKLVNDVKTKFEESVTREIVTTELSPRMETEGSFTRESRARKSFSQAWSSFFRKNHPEKNSKVETLVNLPDGSGYRFINNMGEGRCSAFATAPREKRAAAVCAVLLEEWLLELAALAEEQSVNGPAVFAFPFLPR